MLLLSESESIIRKLPILGYPLLDGESLESAEKCLKNVLADFERQGNRMKSGGYVDKRVSFYSILCMVQSLVFMCMKKRIIL